MWWHPLAFLAIILISSKLHVGSPMLESKFTKDKSWSMGIGKQSGEERRYFFLSQKYLSGILLKGEEWCEEVGNRTTRGKPAACCPQSDGSRLVGVTAIFSSSSYTSCLLVPIRTRVGWITLWLQLVCWRSVSGIFKKTLFVELNSYQILVKDQ